MLVLNKSDRERQIPRYTSSVKSKKQINKHSKSYREETGGHQRGEGWRQAKG